MNRAEKEMKGRKGKGQEGEGGRIDRNEQKAQLPLRNRESAMQFFVAKLLSIAVNTYSYVYHPHPSNLLRTPIKRQHATTAHAHDVRPHCRLMSPFYRTPAKNYINVMLPETRVLSSSRNSKGFTPSKGVK